MKKLLTFLLLTLSIQLFSANYKVVLKKGVTLSQQEIAKNNNEIEIAAKRDYNLLMQATMQGANSMISGMLNQQLLSDSLDKKFETKMKTFYSDLFDTMMKKSKISIEKIRYVTNDIVEVTLDFKMPNTAGNLQKYTQTMVTDFLTNNNLEKMSEDEFMDKFMTKMFKDMKKMYENTDSYMSLKGTIYLEKDNGKWGVAELEEKLENYRQMYKISK
nr:hypothetical protein [uncultured Leptotrichia sp.]